ncbi:MAG TPA: T9SS type A sorting domain-containing protein [Candidatus Binatia bacterium]|nr:T9SS type A sorting domain-containing protein [Candidatus Binatia bacterium]
MRTPLKCIVTGALALAASAGPALGVPLFFSTPSFQLPARPLTLALGDLNRDGKADLVALNGPGQVVSVFLSAGDGTFQPGVTHATGSGPSQVLIGDVNGDGNPDLLTGNAGSVSVLLGNGDGTFATHADYPMSGVGLAAGDLNGDGKLDVASTTSVLMGNGDGTFRARVDYAPGSDAFHVAAGDLNGDGNADLVTLGYSTFSVYLSHGDGTFAPAAAHSQGTPAAAFRRPGAPSRTRVAKAGSSAEYFGNDLWLAVGDVSGDGTPDLLLVNGQGGQFVSTVAVLLGVGDGTFQPRADDRTQDYPSYVAIGDLNADGRPDILTANDWSATVSILPGHGDGTFAPHQEYGASGWCFSAGIGDVNGDGRPDIVSGDFPTTPGSQGVATVYLGNADGTFQARNSYETHRQPVDLVVADLDSDGRPDVATADWDVNLTSVLFGNGDGSCQERRDYDADWNARFVASGDLDGDGRADFLLVNESGTINILLSNGDRTFRRKDMPNGNNAPMALGDLNADGKLDMVTAGSAFLGNGDGTFGPGLAYDNQGGLGRPALVDLNGDAKLDLVNANSTGSSVSIHFGNGDGTFQPEVVYATGSHPSSVAIGDLNRDGRLDLVAANPGSNSLSVLLGRAGGDFDPHVDYTAGTVGSGANVVQVGDLDGDGNLDLASTGGGAVSVLRGNGNGTFGAPQSYKAFGAGALALADLNGDGSLDLIAANANTYNVSVLLNLSARGSSLSAGVAIDPGVINLTNHAPSVTAYIQPVGFDPTDVDVSSLRLAASLPAMSKSARVVDHDGDGVSELMVKFARGALDPLLTPGMNNLEVTGSLVTGEHFGGHCVVRVMQSPGGSAHHPFVSPNPINPQGTLSFYVAEPGTVRVRLFDRDGRLVRTVLDAQTLTAGPHQVAIDGRGDQHAPLASGVYFYKVETSDGAVTGRFTILK